MDLESVLGEVSVQVRRLKIGTNVSTGFAIAENKALLSALIGSLDFKAAPGSPENPKIIFTITSRIVGGPQVTASIVDGW